MAWYGHSYASAASTIGMSFSAPVDSVNELTVQVSPVSSKITDWSPTTTILACESSSVLLPSDVVVRFALDSNVPIALSLVLDSCIEKFREPH